MGNATQLLLNRAGRAIKLGRRIRADRAGDGRCQHTEKTRWASTKKVEVALENNQLDARRSTVALKREAPRAPEK